MLDSISFSNINKQLPLENADMIEVLPGIMPKVIRRLADTTGKPVIAGGLISDKEGHYQCAGGWSGCDFFDQPGCLDDVNWPLIAITALDLLPG